jgi:hypothetical protein
MPRGGTALSKQVELVYHDQSAEELSYRLFRGRVDAGAVSLVPELEVSWNGQATVTLRLLASACAVEIAVGGQVLSELVAPGDRPAGEELDSFSLRTAVNREYELPGLKLDVRAGLERFGRADRRDWVKRARERLEGWLPSDSAGYLLVRRAPDEELPVAAERAAALATLATHPLTLLWADPSQGWVRAVQSHPGEAILACRETRVVLTAGR